LKPEKFKKTFKLPISKIVQINIQPSQFLKMQKFSTISDEYVLSPVVKNKMTEEIKSEHHSDQHRSIKLGSDSDEDSSLNCSQHSDETSSISSSTYLVPQSKLLNHLLKEHNVENLEKFKLAYKIIKD